jgi:hypothetical protein
MEEAQTIGNYNKIGVCRVGSRAFGFLWSGTRHANW